MYPDVDKTTPIKKSDPSCPPPQPPPTQTCCELVCFERPNYFCGHMLTDADLSKEQWYFREKNKLYHKTLHGHGVVCGLRLTCDPECHGGIIIDEGFAIDDCGNDLVVCKPERFDVIGQLRKKGWLIETPVSDPCKPQEKDPECKVRQCFYITSCYQEEPAEFTTPFVAGCKPHLTECEPTRIRETVRFEVTDVPLKKPIVLEDLSNRIQECLKLLTEEFPFKKALDRHAQVIEVAIKGPIEKKTHDDYCTAFYELRGYFLLYLQKYPDKYNCTIEEEIRCIPFPPNPKREKEEKEYDESSYTETSKPKSYNVHYPQEIKDAFCRLLELAWQHIIACIHGEMIFSCPEPTQASCVVLGTVEVENGRLIRVCNCPRDYVWSFASFFQVLVATLLGGKACEEPGDNGQTCCQEFKVDCELNQKYGKALLEGSTALPDAIMKLRKWLESAFDFTKPEFVPPGLFWGRDEDTIRKVAKDFNIQLAIQKLGHEDPSLNVLDTLQSLLPKTKGDHITAIIKGKRGIGGLAEMGKDFQIQEVEETAEKALSEVKDLRQVVEENRLEIKGLSKRLENAENKAAQSLRDLKVIEGESQNLKDQISRLSGAGGEDPKGPSQPPSGRKK